MKKSMLYGTTLALLMAIVAAYVPHLRAGETTLDEAPAGSFSIVVIPDTQKYLGRATKATPDSEAPVSNAVFEAHVRWIAENLQTQRVAFVSHVGDIVDRNVPEQWEVARRAMDHLHGKIPYAISVGNHDMASNGDSSLFQQYFPASRFAGFDWYAGSFRSDRTEPVFSGDNANSCVLFSAEGLEFVFLHLECNAPDDVLQWANAVLEQHFARIAMITTHMDLGPVEQPRAAGDFFGATKGRMQWKKCHGARGNTPEQMWEKCYRRHANLLAIFSGDQSRTTACYLKSVGDHGNTVHALMSDYTSSGPLRIYRFLPGENRIRVITWDTTLECLCEETRYVPGRENHQFVMEWNTAATPPRDGPEWPCSGPDCCRTHGNPLEQKGPLSVSLTPPHGEFAPRAVAAGTPAPLP